jgi:hypothetical protein
VNAAGREDDLAVDFSVTFRKDERAPRLTRPRNSTSSPIFGARMSWMLHCKATTGLPSGSYAAPDVTHSARQAIRPPWARFHTLTWYASTRIAVTVAVDPSGSVSVLVNSRPTWFTNALSVGS